MSNDDVSLTKNEPENRFELWLGDTRAGLIDYRVAGDGTRNMFHTEIDPAFGGRGLGGKLVAFAIDDAREQGYKVKPTCPFIARYLDQHPEFEDLRA